MNTFVSGESDAKGLSVILPYIAFDRADVAIRRPGTFGMLGIWLGKAGWARRGMAGLEQGRESGPAWQGWARPGKARQGKE